MLTYSHSGLFAFESLDNAEDDDTIVIPDAEAIQALSDEDLEELESKLIDTFDELYDAAPTDPEGVANLDALAKGVEAARSEKTRREEVRAEAAAKAQALHDKIHGTSEEPDAGEGDEAPDGGDEVQPTAEAPKVADPAPVAVAASAAGREPAVPRRTQRLNVGLAEIRARAAAKAANDPAPQPRLNITAAASVPRYHAGHQFADLDELGHAYHERAKSMATAMTGEVDGPKVAHLTRDFDNVIGRDTPPAEVERIFKEITDVDRVLVAGGGWCAPSEITYEFFDITCEDGMIDLPTVGIERGGIRFPTSPSLADVFTGTFTNATNPWLWTETDDILTVTGSTNKPCVRVPCPGFTEVRLECYGICLTAGNLTDAAYPEATRRQLGLLQSAHFHAQNQRYIASMVALSTASAATTGGMFNDAGAFSSDILTHAEWAATDYRNRYGMCDNNVLELVLPAWAKAVFRADMAQRTGISELGITDAQIENYFDVRGLRVQWVKDWQVRGTNQPGGSSPTGLFPTSVQFMLYPAGTFVRGNGLVLDLGVVRDSVLNAENDHTAAWMEECHLIAKYGHESRLYTVGICAAGRTGIANLADCRTS